MNYIQQINGFWNWTCTNEVSNTEIALYFAILNIANKAGWKSPLTIPNSSLARFEATAMKRARNRLEQLGLITYSKGKRGQAPRYTITSLYSDEDTETEKENETYSQDDIECKYAPSSQNDNNTECKYAPNNDIECKYAPITAPNTAPNTAPIPKLKETKLYNNNIYNNTSSSELKRDEQSVNEEKPSKKPKRKAEPEKSESKALMKLTLISGEFYGFTEEDKLYYEKLYPAVDIMQEVRNMAGWLDANERRKPTAKGIKRFINSWLAKKQDRLSTFGQNGRSSYPNQNQNATAQTSDKPYWKRSDEEWEAYFADCDIQKGGGKA